MIWGEWVWNMRVRCGIIRTNPFISKWPLMIKKNSIRPIGMGVEVTPVNDNERIWND